MPNVLFILLLTCFCEVASNNHKKKKKKLKWPINKKYQVHIQTSSDSPQAHRAPRNEERGWEKVPSALQVQDSRFSCSIQGSLFWEQKYNINLNSSVYNYLFIKINFIRNYLWVKNTKKVLINFLYLFFIFLTK